MRVDESWQKRVCMRVFSTVMSWSNENKSCLRVDKGAFVWDFSELSCPGHLTSQKFLFEFNFMYDQLSLIAAWWYGKKARLVFTEILVKNTRNKKVWTFPCFQWLSLFESDCQIKRQLQPNSGTSKPHKSGWLFEIFFVISWSNKNKSYMRVDVIWQERVCMRVFSTVMSWLNENKS